jgi:hypothetical protein
MKQVTLKNRTIGMISAVTMTFSMVLGGGFLCRR